MQFDALLADLPATFDKIPDTDLVLQVSHADGIAWAVAADNRLTVSVGSGSSVTYDLRDHTLSGLSLALGQDLAIQTLYINPDTAELGAAALCHASGSTPDDRAADLRAYRSPLLAHIATLATALDRAETDGTAALGQLILPTAAGWWIDFWGKHFGVPRAAGEADQSYAQRIIDEVFRARNNNRAMENNVVRYTGHTVDVYEPWRDMFFLSVSRLSGNHYLPGAYHAYHVLHPIAPGAVNWDTALPVIEADRPAGSIVWPFSHRRPPTLIPLWETDPSAHLAISVIVPRSIHRLQYRLSVDLLLSGEGPERQPQALIGHWYTAALGPMGDDFEIDAGREHVRAISLVLFGGYSPFWVGAWDSDTWADRSNGISIPVPSQRSQETA